MMFTRIIEKEIRYLFYMFYKNFSFYGMCVLFNTGYRLDEQSIDYIFSKLCIIRVPLHKLKTLCLKDICCNKRISTNIFRL